MPKLSKVMSTLMQLAVTLGTGTIILVVVLAITYFIMSGKVKQDVVY